MLRIYCIMWHHRSLLAWYWNTAGQSKLGGGRRREEEEEGEEEGREEEEEGERGRGEGGR